MVSKADGVLARSKYENREGTLVPRLLAVVYDNEFSVPIILTEEISDRLESKLMPAVCWHDAAQRRFFAPHWGLPEASPFSWLVFLLFAL